VALKLFLVITLWNSSAFIARPVVVVMKGKSSTVPGRFVLNLLSRIVFQGG
jgi:hypothetical protein